MGGGLGPRAGFGAQQEGCRRGSSRSPRSVLRNGGTAPNRRFGSTLAEKPRGRQALARLYAATQCDVCPFSRQRSPTAPAVANFCVKPKDIGAHRTVGTCLSTPGTYLYRAATECLRTAELGCERDVRLDRAEGITQRLFGGLFSNS